MTDLQDQAIEPQDPGAEASPAAPASLSRRAMLRGAAIAAPTIVSLGSASAALAASSFRTYTGISTAGTDGNYYCLEEDTTLGPAESGQPNALDVGTTPAPTIQKYAEKDYKIEKNNSPINSISEVRMCQESNVSGTTYYYQENGGWKGVQVRRGILMSAVAMSSINGVIVNAPISNV